MKCCKHPDCDAVGVCAYCGRAMCAACVGPGDSPLACTARCSEELGCQAEALRTLIERSRQSARANAVYCYLSAGLSAAAAVAAWFLLPLPFLVWFAAGGSVALLAAGYWHGRVARTGTRRAKDRA